MLTFLLNIDLKSIFTWLSFADCLCGLQPVVPIPKLPLLHFFEGKGVKEACLIFTSQDVSSISFRSLLFHFSFISGIFLSGCVGEA